jgi:hypothetical protein
MCRSRFRLLVALGAFTATAGAIELPVKSAGGAKLAFDASGEFRLMQISDLHYGENKAWDEKTTNLVRSLLRINARDFEKARLGKKSGANGVQ